MQSIEKDTWAAYFRLRHGGVLQLRILFVSVFLVVIMCAPLSSAQIFTDPDTDHFFADDVYDILDIMEPDELIPIALLYENDAQKFMVQNEFGDDPSQKVTKYGVVRLADKQFKLGAILLLGNKDGRYLSSYEQNVFIQENREVLLQTSQAMIEGRYNPFFRDVMLVGLLYQ